MIIPDSIRDNKYRVSPIGTLFNIQTDRPTRKYNHKMGTFHVGLKTNDIEGAKTLVNKMEEVQYAFGQQKQQGDKPLLSLPYKIDGEFYNFNPFRLNSCGWDSKKNNAYVNQPRIFSAENKELDNRLHEFKQADEHMGRVLYSIIPYLNQEGIGIVLRLRGIQFQNYIPMYKAS